LKKKFLILGILAIVILSICTFIGTMHISISDLFVDSQTTNLWLNLRIPRVLLGFIAGACLAISGMSFQAVFRNPLAEPFTLGISSGASLGAVIYFSLGFGFSILGINGIAVFAFIGSFLSILLVYSLTGIRKNFSTSDMLLSGIAVNFFFSAIILLFQFLGNQYNLGRIMHWTMGGLEVTGFNSIYQSLPFIIVGMFVILYLCRELNLLSAGEDIAVSRGVDVSKTKKLIFFASSLMIGAVCATCGPIAFVGMICPHICRLIFGSEHRILSIACILFGGIFLVVCDTIARTVIAPVELPVGIITSILGGPFFIWLLNTNNKL